MPRIVQDFAHAKSCKEFNEFSATPRSRPPSPGTFPVLIPGYALWTVSERKTDNSTHLYNLLVTIVSQKFLVQKLYSLMSATRLPANLYYQTRWL